MLPFDLHVICCEGDAGSTWRGVEAILYIFLSLYVGQKDLSVVRASCRASLVDFDSLRSSYKVIRAGMLAN